MIGIGGQMGVGKTVLANYLRDRLNCRKVAFADALKDIFCTVFDKDISFVEKWKRKNEIPPGMNVTIRKALQIIGCEFRGIQSDVWIRNVFNSITDLGSVIVDDVRFLNECRAIKEEGGVVIIIWRPGFQNEDKFETEIGELVSGCLEVDGPAGGADLFIKNNGTLKDLYSKADQIILPYIVEV